jgi:hypothetical protein
MKLYCVAIRAVFPPQCVTVSDSESYADAMCAALKQELPLLAEYVHVEPVEEFFPAGYVNCDTAWSQAAQRVIDQGLAYQMGKHGATRKIYS